MELVEVTVTFVVPEDRANDFSTALSGWIDRLYLLDHLLAYPWAYLGVWQEEWVSDPPTMEGGFRFSQPEKFSREKSLFLASSHVRSSDEDRIKWLKIKENVNEGVAPRCKTLCTMMNTDYCRLKCDEDRLEPLDFSPVSERFRAILGCYFFLLT
jgi:hypothetical protein